MYVALNIFNLLLLNRPNKLVISGEKNPLYCPDKLCESDEEKLKFKSGLWDNQTSASSGTHCASFAIVGIWWDLP